MLHRAFIARTPFTIVGPAGLEERLESLFRAAWGVDWETMRRELLLTYVETGERGTVAGMDLDPVQLAHGSSRCPGYQPRRPPPGWPAHASPRPPATECPLRRGRDPGSWNDAAQPCDALP
mgnify:CR=1 FL=1